jgi:hypothetical protein
LAGRLGFRAGDFVLEFIAGFFEFAHAFADASREIGKFFRSEKEKDDEEDKDHFLGTEGADEGERMGHGDDNVQRLRDVSGNFQQSEDRLMNDHNFPGK